MNTNYANNTNKSHLILPELSYKITGILFDAHNTLGRFAREKQYGDFIESLLKARGFVYEREFRIGMSGNTADFLVDNKLLIELKAKRIILREDFHQVQRYLQASGKDLALLVNFRNQFLRPIRIIRITTDARSKYAQATH
jgi:GxxExxY protein